MATSLALQLQNIGAVDANKSGIASQTHRTSFLFDSKQAADYDLNTIYSIGLTGLEELKKIDQIFIEFDNTLFSNSMKDFDRVLKVCNLCDFEEKKISI
jgi:U3 small nucleolar RNA-associated protein 10